MATFHGQTVDLFEDFEDALDVSWATTNPDTNLSLSADAAYAGSQGLLVNANGATAGGDVAFVRYDMGAEKTDLSVGFWFRGPAYAASTTDMLIFGWATASIGTNNIRGYYRKSSGTYKIAIRGTGFSANIDVSSGTWYWITIDLHKNTTCTLRIYDITNTQVGSDATCTANNNAGRYLYYGCLAALDENVNHHWDDAVADWTDATWPLLGWDVGGATPLNLNPWPLGMNLGMNVGMPGSTS